MKIPYNLIALPSNLGYILTGALWLLGVGEITRDLLVESLSKYLIPFLIVVFIVIIFWWNNLIVYLLKLKLNKFYKHIMKGEFEKSWNLLSKDFQKSRWSENLDVFAKGYKFTKQINLLAIIQVKKNFKERQFIVLFEDNVESPVIRGFSNLHKKTIGQFESVKALIDDTRINLQNQGKDVGVFNSLMLGDIFKANFSDIVRWKYGVDNLKNVEEMAPMKKYFRAEVITLNRKNLLSLYRIKGIRSISSFEIN